MNKFFPDDRSWIEEISMPGVFEDKATGWISETKTGALKIEDVLLVTAKVAEYRGTPDLVNYIRAKLGLS